MVSKIPHHWSHGLVSWQNGKERIKHKNVRRYILFSIYFMSLIKWPITVKMRLKYPKPHLGCKYLKGNEIRVTQRRLPWIESALVHFGKNEIEWWLLFFLLSPNEHRHQPKSTHHAQIIDVFNWTIWTRMVTWKGGNGERENEQKKTLKDYPVRIKKGKYDLATVGA